MSWYKNKERPTIKLAQDESFEWVDVSQIDNSYDIVTIKLAEKTHNFYLWSSKTVQSAKKLYDNEDFVKSLKMLKKYCFDMNTLGD